MSVTAKARPKATRSGRPTTRRASTAPDMSATWVAYKKTGDPDLRNQLVEAYYYLVKVIGNRVGARLPRSIDVQDLRSAGVFGLMRAIDNYDLERGTPFESYCATRVRGAILDELRAQDWVPRLVRNRASQFNEAHRDLCEELGREPDDHEVAGRLEVGVGDARRMRREANLTSVFTLTAQEERDDDPRTLRRLDALMDRGSEVPFERLVSQDLSAQLVKGLNRNEQTVVALYYKEGLTMKEIGRVLGISESRVCQIHSKTLEKLKGSLDRMVANPRYRVSAN